MWMINNLVRLALFVAVVAGLTACGSIGPRPSVPAGDLYKVIRHEAGR